ncbi:UNKNOWN [Stylonychia lemnae]|uniref:Uncharacterized protein n=1 Tax=Stylonychia lemnae TaxID=5949 RepID=A0A078A8E8_STYLE|nr:UNKNOWN [Stylonychia lemnae]|eukprot:CDW78535.1 UNKNOWN [Stylonychia lemnae]
MESIDSIQRQKIGLHIDGSQTDSEIYPIRARYCTELLTLMIAQNGITYFAAAFVNTWQLSFQSVKKVEGQTYLYNHFVLAIQNVPAASIEGSFLYWAQPLLNDGTFNVFKISFWPIDIAQVFSYQNDQFLASQNNYIASLTISQYSASLNRMFYCLNLESHSITYTKYSHIVYDLEQSGIQKQWEYYDPTYLIYCDDIHHNLTTNTLFVVFQSYDFDIDAAFLSTIFINLNDYNAKQDQNLTIQDSLLMLAYPSQNCDYFDFKEQAYSFNSITSSFTILDDLVSTMMVMPSPSVLEYASITSGANPESLLITDFPKCPIKNYKPIIVTSLQPQVFYQYLDNKVRFFQLNQWAQISPCNSYYFTYQLFNVDYSRSFSGKGSISPKLNKMTINPFQTTDTASFGNYWGSQRGYLQDGTAKTQTFQITINFPPSAANSPMNPIYTAPYFTEEIKNFTVFYDQILVYKLPNVVDDENDPYKINLYTQMEWEKLYSLDNRMVSFLIFNVSVKVYYFALELQEKTIYNLT